MNTRSHLGIRDELKILNEDLIKRIILLNHW